MKAVSYFPTSSPLILLAEDWCQQDCEKKNHDVTNFLTNKSKLQIVRSLNSCSWEQDFLKSLLRLKYDLI